MSDNLSRDNERSVVESMLGSNWSVWICAGMAAATVALMLATGYSRGITNAWMDFLWVVSPYAAVAFVSYLVRKNSVAAVFALLAALAAALLGLGLLRTLSLTDSAHNTAKGMAVGLGPLGQWVAIASIAGLGVISVIVHKLWRASMARPTTRRAAWGAAAAALGAVAGVAALCMAAAVVMLIGQVEYDVAWAVGGVAVATVVAAAIAGFIFRARSAWPARVIGGVLGGSLGGLVFVAYAAESWYRVDEWVFIAGLCGLAAALPSAAIAGELAGLAVSKLSSGSSS